MNGWKVLGIIIVTGTLLFAAISVAMEFFGLPHPFNKEESNFTVDESKNKLAVIIKKDGIYDTSEIRDKLNSFLDAVKNDLDIDNVGVCRVEANSLNELDQFVEQLYHEKDVGYIIMVGRNLAWEGDEWKELNSDIRSAFWHVNDELCYLEEREPDEQGKPTASSEIRDIAISWIMAPDICYSNGYTDEIDNMKREIISNVILFYTRYHIDPEKILNQFKQSCLYIFRLDALNTFYSQSFDNSYQFDWTLVLNTQYDKVWEEMKKKHLVLDYHVHGTKSTLMINHSESDAFTTVDEYVEFIEKNGLPSLFVDASACECDVFQHDCSHYGINYCWPQVNICNGVWAYYSLSSSACKAISTTSPFFGHALRHYRSQTIVYGDITAHMT